MRTAKRHYSYMDAQYELHHFSTKKEAVKAVSRDTSKPALWLSEIKNDLLPVITQVVY